MTFFKKKLMCWQVFARKKEKYQDEKIEQKL